MLAVMFRLQEGAETRYELKLRQEGSLDKVVKSFRGIWKNTNTTATEVGWRNYTLNVQQKADWLKRSYEGVIQKANAKEAILQWHGANIKQAEKLMEKEFFQYFSLKAAAPK